jgi:hypothetical protein
LCESNLRYPATPGPDAVPASQKLAMPGEPTRHAQSA